MDDESIRVKRKFDDISSEGENIEDFDFLQGLKDQTKKLHLDIPNTVTPKKGKDRTRKVLALNQLTMRKVNSAFAFIVLNETLEFLTHRFNCTANSDLVGLKGMQHVSRSLQNSFRIIKQVGSGTFGEVYKGFDIKNNVFVALKKIHVHIEKEGFPITALREIKLLRKLRQESILNLREVVPATTEGIGLQTSFMVLEYMDYDLTGVLENNNVSLDLPMIKCLLKQLLEGMYFVHTNKVMHRDMKAANLLLNNSGDLKIGDWGLARSWVKDFEYTTRVVTLWYRAPELLLGLKNYGLEIDIWAIGCIFAEMLSKKCILTGKDEADQLNLIFELCGTPTAEDWPLLYQKYVDTEKIQLVKRERTLEHKMRFVSSDAVALLKEMLILDPSKRITASQALDHDFFWKGAVVDSKSHFIDKLKKQIGEDKFSKGMHEYELRELLKSTQAELIPHPPILTQSQFSNNSTALKEFNRPAIRNKSRGGRRFRGKSRTQQKDSQNS